MASKRKTSFFLTFFCSCLVVAGQPAQTGEMPARPGTAALREIERLIDGGQLGLARTRLKEEAAVLGENYETWLLESRILFGERRHNESLRTLERCFALNKKDARVHLLSGLNWVILNRLDLARPFLEESARLSPQDPMAFYHLGRYYYTAQRFVLAEQAFRTAVRLDPDLGKGYDNLGLALEAQQKGEEAVASYRKAMELTERQGIKNEWPYLNLAKFLLARERQEESLALADKAWEMNPQSAEVSYVRGKALHKLGKEAEALEALQRSIRADPAFAESHYLLGRIYLKQGRKLEAQRELELFQQIKKSEKKGGTMAATRGR